MKLKFGLRARFLVLFVIFSILISWAAGYITQKKFEETIWNQYKKNAIETANLAVAMIDGDKFEQYALTLKKDEDYEQMQENLNQIRRMGNVAYIYALKVISDFETIYVFDTWEENTPKEEIGQLGGREAYDKTYTGIAKAMESKKTNEEFEVTAITRFGYNATIYAPVLNSKEEAVGVIGVDVAMNDIKSTAAAAVKDMLSVMISIIIFFLFFLLIVIQNSFIKPIRLLKSCVEEMAAGNLGVQAPVWGKTEIAEISRVFNEMSYNISIHMKEMEALNKGYHKFVPEQMFHILQKPDITRIHLGDYQETRLTVLSMQVRDFEAITKAMETRELFAFINRIYHEAVPCIQSRDGVIGEYYKGGFLAFCQKSCQEMLDGAIVICQHFYEVRKQMKGNDSEKCHLNFGISHGMVMLGIVGDKERIAASMLSEQIEAAEHLKSVAWKYRSEILITGAAAQEIPDFFTQYSNRFMGMIHFRTSGQTEKIYDVFDGDSMKDREHKKITKDKFEEGVKKFLKKEFYEARLCFIEVLKLYRQDYAAREYLYRCNCYYQNSESAQEADIYIETI